MKKKTMVQRLEEYFKNTPDSEIDRAWKEAEEETKDVESPSVIEYLKELNTTSQNSHLTMLWLDDMRNPFMKQWADTLKQTNTDGYRVTWVRNFDEFSQWIYENGLPNFISYDHDLADEHYTPSEYWDDYDKSKEYQDAQSYREKTGLDCAKFIIDYCLTHERELPKFYCHSANPVGRDNINSILNQFRESQKE